MTGTALYHAQWRRSRTGMIAVLLAMLCFVHPGQLTGADEKPVQFLLAWGQKGGQPGEFYSPIHIAINHKDEVYVADLNNARVQKFTADGKYLGGFNLPLDKPPRKSCIVGGMTLDDKGAIYLSFMNQHKIGVYSESGQLLREWGKPGKGDGEFNQPGGIVLRPDGTLYVTDQCNHRIQKFTIDGKFLGKWGEHGLKLGQFGGNDKAGSRFGGPHSLAQDSHGRLYTSEGTVGRVQQLSADGKPLLAWGDKGDQPGGFGALKTGYAGHTFGPVGVMVDRHDRVWVSSLNDRVQAFTPDGKFLFGIGGSGKDSGHFARPHGMAVDSKGRLYVADAGNQRIQKFEIPNVLRGAGVATVRAAAKTAPDSKPTAAAKSVLDRCMDTLFAATEFKDVSISPDAHRLAWVEIRASENALSPRSAIFMADLGAPSLAPRRITAGDGTAVHAEHGIAWSPDSSKLAFLSNREKKGQLQLYVAAIAGGPARKLTNLTGFLADPRWSPDGKHIAVLFTENAQRPAGPVQPAAPEVGVIEEHVYEQRLGIVDLDSGQVRLVSPADLYVYEYDWSPDGRSLAAIAAHGSGDNNWYIAELYTLAVASGEMKTILKPGMQIAMPRWSPDGKTIAFIGGLMSDEGSNGGDIFTVPASGGQPRNLTPGMKVSASWLTWLPSSKQILFSGHLDGGSALARVNGADGKVEILWSGPETTLGERGAFGVSLARDEKTCALVRHSFQQPPEVWAGTVGHWKQVTHANKDLRAAWGDVKTLHWKSDGFTVQGWLMYPRDFDPRRRYPMVVSVHGGPASSKRPGWPRPHFDFSVLSADGYFVFFPNPRGSFGQGEEFTRANVKDFGHGDLRDILHGVDEVVKTVPVDEGRLGLVGWSYGGYMTMWTVTQTGRFRAAVAGAGIANWQSYYGQNGIDQWLIPYFGASVYDDPAVYARSSPITYIKRVQTPTLVVVGDGDLECPVPQSYEFWRALRTLKVPTQLVVYPNEGHLIGLPKHRRDIMQRSLAWLDRYLGEKKAGAVNQPKRPAQ